MLVSDEMSFYPVQNAANLQSIDHCVDLLRQIILCDADVGLIVYHWEGKDRIPQAKFATEHVCRNYDRINDWVLANKWNEESVFDPVSHSVDQEGVDRLWQNQHSGDNGQT